MVNISKLHKYKYYIIILLLVVHFILSRKKLEECSTFSGKLLYIIHLYFSIYLYFGWIFFENKKLHLLIVIIVLIHWFFNKRCIITTITNKLCDYDKNDKFEDLLYKLNLIKYNKQIRYIIITIIIIIDIYMIKKL